MPIFLRGICSGAIRDMRSREIVLSDLRSAIGIERECTLRVLRLLREVERDRHFLEMGYPSLFEFATRELGYSAPAAQRRISAMRLLKAVPEAEGAIAEGSLILDVAAKTQAFFRQEKGIPIELKREIVQSMVGLTTRECERKLIALSPESALPKDVMRPIAEGKTLVQFVADDELIGKLEKLKGLLAHRNYDGKLNELIDALAEIALKKLDPETRPRVRSLPAPEVQSRYIPVHVRRTVRKRDGGRCTFVDPQSGRRCGSRHGIQYDHIQPYSMGGPSTVENLRLLCGNHNRHVAEKINLSRRFQETAEDPPEEGWSTRSEDPCPGG